MSWRPGYRNLSRKHTQTNLGQINEKLTGLAYDRSGAANTAPWPHQFDGVHQFAATITLIATRIFVATTGMRTIALNETIGQIAITLCAQQLIDRFGVHVTSLVQTQKHFLCYSKEKPNYFHCAQSPNRHHTYSVCSGVDVRPK